MSQEEFHAQFMAPLFRRVRTRFTHNTVLDDFVPFRKHQEILEYLEQIEPDKLLMSVAEGADAACKAYQISSKSKTWSTIGNLINNATKAADDMRSPWQAHLDRVRSAPRKGAIHGTMTVGSMAVQGKLSVGHALKSLVMNFIEDLIDPREINQIVRETHACFDAMDHFLVVVVNDLDHSVLPTLAAEIRR